MNHAMDNERIISLGFCQFSNKLLSSPNSEISSKLYQKCYANMPGYSFNEHILELPYWINIIVGMCNPRHRKELVLIEDIDDAIGAICKARFDLVFFSVMNVNEAHIIKIVARCPETRFIVGGYTNPSSFEEYENVTYLSSVLELGSIGELDADISSPPDYSLFTDGAMWMPRITLSTGCDHKCKFCAVPRVLVEIDKQNVIAQAKAFNGLSFQLVYLDDKTFGQASNYRLLASVYNEIKIYNPGFLGFVVQTTATTLTANDGQLLYEFMNELNVRYIEVGVETFDDRLLAKLRKPHRIKHLEQVCAGIRSFNGQRSRDNTSDDGRVGLIPNLLFGVKGDTYSATVQFVRENIDIIATVNFANISSYPGNRGGDYLPYEGPEDGDDYSFRKSWLDDKQVELGKRALEQILKEFDVNVQIQ